MRQTGNGAVAPADGLCPDDLEQRVQTGTRRVVQLHDDARYQFLLAEDDLNTARTSLKPGPLPTLTPMPKPPSIVTVLPAYERSQHLALVIGLTSMATLALSWWAVVTFGTPEPRRLALLTDDTKLSIPAGAAVIAPGKIGPASGDNPGQTIYAARFSKVSPAERQCLASAVYYEARGETTDGQIAVAQVVLNRVRSVKWADSICGVIFQGAERGEKCQFSFACTNHPTEPSGTLWEQSLAIADQALQGQGWLREALEATHYHATSVSPVWRQGLVQIGTFGNHMFYREPEGFTQARGPKAITGVQTMRTARSKPERTEKTEHGDRPAPTQAKKQASDDNWSARLFQSQ